MMDDNLYWYEAELADEEDVSTYTRPIVDGDSVYLWLDLGLHSWTMQLCRLAGIDTPERGEDGFGEATTALKAMLTAADQLIVRSEELGKYGRPIVTLHAHYEDNDEWRNVNEEMLEEGYAEDYA